MNKIKSFAQHANDQTLATQSPPDSGRNPLVLKGLGLDEAITPLAVRVSALQYPLSLTQRHRERFCLPVSISKAYGVV